MKKNNFRILDFWIVTTVLFVALAFRLYKIDIPLADLHSWRQADTASVARNFARNGYDLLHPRYDDLSNIGSGKENPQGYRMVEFPIYNAFFAFAFQKIPGLPIEIWGRLVSIIFSLAIVGTIYFLTLKEAGRTAAFFAALTYAVMPFFVFFSRVILPDTTATALSILAILFLYGYFQIKKRFVRVLLWTAGLVFFAASILVKPTAIFFSVVLFYLFAVNYRFSLVKKLDFYLFFILAVIPIFLWRNYILQYPEGIPGSEWLLTSVNTASGMQKIFFKPAFFRWIFFERINNLILGGYLVFFFILGIIAKPKGNFFYSFLFSSLFYLFFFQGGNVQHEYYQILILPTIAIFVGLGVAFVLKKGQTSINSFFAYTLVLIIFAFSWFFSYYRVKDFYSYSSDLPQIVKIISSLTKDTDKVVTDSTGDTTLLYLIDRKGAPAPYKEMDELKKSGYCCFVTFNQSVITGMKQEKKHPVIFENDKFALFEL